MSTPFGLPVQERLKHKKRIEELFSKGSSFFVYPFKVFYAQGQPLSHTGYPQVLFTVPKRRYRKAYQRHQFRRKMREVYRLQKSMLCASPQEGTQIVSLGFVFVGKPETSFADLEKGMKKALQKIATSHGAAPADTKK